MTATPRQPANSSAVGAAVPTRSARGPGSAARPSPVRDRDGARGAREEARRRASEGRGATGRQTARGTRRRARVGTGWSLGHVPAPREGGKTRKCACGGEEGKPGAATRRSAPRSRSPRAGPAAAAAGPSRGGSVGRARGEARVQRKVGERVRVCWAPGGGEGVLQPPDPGRGGSGPGMSPGAGPRERVSPSCRSARSSPRADTRGKRRGKVCAESKL